MLVFPYSFLTSIQQRFVGQLLSVTQRRRGEFNPSEAIIFTKDMHRIGPEDAKMNVPRATFEMLTKDTVLTLRECTAPETNGRCSSTH